MILLNEFKEKYAVSIFYKYHQVRVSETEVQFGWINTDTLDLSKEIVISGSELSVNENCATSLEDYRRYFVSLTSLKPDEFISKWSGNLTEYALFWKSTHQDTDNENHLFVLNLAKLIHNREPFSMYDTTYRVVSSIVNIED